MSAKALSLIVSWGPCLVWECRKLCQAPCQGHVALSLSLEPQAAASWMRRRWRSTTRWFPELPTTPYPSILGSCCQESDVGPSWPLASGRSPRVFRRLFVKSMFCRLPAFPRGLGAIFHSGGSVSPWWVLQFSQSMLTSTPTRVHITCIPASSCSLLGLVPMGSRTEL